jgi:hypothetical protein
MTTTSSSSTNDQEVSESHLSATSRALYRLTDIEFTMMLDAIHFVDAYGSMLPEDFQADLQIRKYKADKAIADSIVELQSSFRPMLQQVAEEALTRQEQENQKQQGLPTLGELYDMVRGLQYQIKSLTDKKHKKAKKSQDK